MPRKKEMANGISLTVLLMGPEGPQGHGFTVFLKKTNPCPLFLFLVLSSFPSLHKILFGWVKIGKEIGKERETGLSSLIL
jgi:hypothetical protein